MKKIRRFEDLIAWQKARGLAKAVYVITRHEFANDFELTRQTRKAAVSVMSNIAEGFERSGPNEFDQFLYMAKASCAEVRSQLYVAFDVGYLDRPTFDRLSGQAEEVARVIGGLRVAVERQRDVRKKSSDEKQSPKETSCSPTHRSSPIAHR